MPENTKAAASSSNPQPQQLPSERSDKFFKVYANAAYIETSAWDFTILFGEITRSNEKPIVQLSVGVTMSPQHAKALVAALANNLKEYEKQIGEIKLPQLEPQQAYAEERKPPSVKSA